MIGEAVAGNQRSKILASAILIAVVFFGLYPKDMGGENMVEWLPYEQALLFRSPSMAFLDNFDYFDRQGEPDTFTIVIRFVPLDTAASGVKTLLMLHSGDDREQLIIWQWGASIIVMNGDDYSYAAREPRIETKALLIPGQVCFLVISSGVSGTLLELDGVVVAVQEKLRLRIPASRTPLKMVVGNSVYGNQSWRGRLYNLAIYDHSFQQGELFNDITSEREDKLGTQRQDYLQETAIARYDFQELVSSTILDLSGNNFNLLIPDRLHTLHHRYLAMPTIGSLISMRMVMDILINLVGFIIFSSGLYAVLRPRRPFNIFTFGLKVFFFCLTVSLCLELAQAWIPGRHSSLLDVITNGLGSILGVLFAWKCTSKGLLLHDDQSI